MSSNHLKLESRWSWVLALVAVSLLIAGVTGGSALAHPSSKSISVKTKTRTKTQANSKSRSRSKSKAQTVSAVPPGFVGVDVDGPMFAPQTPLNFDSQVKTMVANGVQSIRVAFNWAAAQPYPSASQIPSTDQRQYVDIAGRPTSFAATDEVVAGAARLHVTVLPTIIYTPAWDALRNPNGIDTPKRDAPYAEYAAALVNRYGPRGSFWSEHPGLPKVPITMWQIWNEPNLASYWPQPYANSYVSLLRLTHAAIKRADPNAQVVLGALTNFAWVAIGQIYKLGHTRNLFDVASVNDFTRTPADVILYIRLTRRAMSRFQDSHKPLLATEISWPSAKGQDTVQHFDFDTTAAGQARDIAQLLPMIGQQRVRLGLAGFYYYTWIGDESKPHPLAFQFAGLLRLLNGKVSPKPALAAFRAGALALEWCRVKGTVATSCLKPAPAGAKPAPAGAKPAPRAPSRPRRR